MRRLRVILATLAVLSGLIFLNNTTLFSSRATGQAPTLVAHRGVFQNYGRADLDRDTCTADRILPPTHDHLENTIASMRAAFAAGADMVEFDVHPTTDGQFAVFHDWTLDCRTDGRGVTREHTMAELKALDIGHNYTADGGRTFPFRGRFRGMMPTLDEVLATFPDRRFAINVKSRDTSEGEKLADVLRRLPPERRAQLIVYGGDEPVAELRRLLPDTTIISRATLKPCLVRYIAYGWTGIVPEACRGLSLLVPVNVAPWLWGWPDRFLSRMASVGSTVIVVGPYHGGSYTVGIDTPDDLARLPAHYSGGIWTNRIEEIGPAVRARSQGKAQ